MAKKIQRTKETSCVHPDKKKMDFSAQFCKTKISSWCLSFHLKKEAREFNAGISQNYLKIL
jgi:hypothetical protein